MVRRAQSIGRKVAGIWKNGFKYSISHWISSVLLGLGSFLFSDLCYLFVLVAGLCSLIGLFCNEIVCVTSFEFEWKWVLLPHELHC